MSGYIIRRETNGVGYTILGMITLKDHGWLANKKEAVNNNCLFSPGEIYFKTPALSFGWLY